MIYTRFGTAVKLVSAREINVWIEQRRGEIKWHYKEPKRTKQTIELDCLPIWHATAECADDRPEHGKKGRMICDGRELDINEFRADGGIAEIVAECERLDQKAEAQTKRAIEEEWRREGTWRIA